jgi:hypothetical protein
MVVTVKTKMYRFWRMLILAISVLLDASLTDDALKSFVRAR